MAAVTNIISRKTLGWHFERVVFSQQGSITFKQLDDLPSQQARPHRANMDAVMLATGSIPLCLRQSHGLMRPAGQYYDGGITDYHFDLPLSHAGIDPVPAFLSPYEPWMV